MKHILTLFFLGSLVACGGGGGGSPTNNSTNYTVSTPYAQGTGLSTGFVPFDVDNNGITDIIITSGNKGTYSVSVQNNQVTYKDLNFITGWMKDWVIKDFSNDGKVDLVWNDHGQEQPVFEFGYNGSLISNGSSYSYQQLPGVKHFYHGLGTYNNDVIISYGQNTLAYYSNNGNGSFTLSQFNLATDIGPNSIGSVKMSTGEKLIVATNATSQTTTQNILFYKSDGTRVITLDYPKNWKDLNMGAFQTITGDFNNQGYDDIILLGESDTNGTYNRGVLYLKQIDGTFVDKTNEVFGDVYSRITIPDKIVPFDINKDGKLDLLGFSYRQNLYTNGQGMYMNVNGKYVATSYGDSSVSGTTQIPMFTTNSDGSWKNLIGLYGVTTPTTTSVNIKVYKN